MYTPTEHMAADKMITLYKKKISNTFQRETKDLVSKFTSSKMYSVVTPWAHLQYVNWTTYACGKKERQKKEGKI